MILSYGAEKDWLILNSLKKSLLALKGHEVSFNNNDWILL